MVMIMVMLRCPPGSLLTVPQPGGQAVGSGLARRSCSSAVRSQGTRHRTRHQGSDLSGAACFKAHLPLLHRLIVTRRHHVPAIQAEAGEVSLLEMTLEG